MLPNTDTTISCTEHPGSCALEVIYPRTQEAKQKSRAPDIVVLQLNQIALLHAIWFNQVVSSNAKVDVNMKGLDVD